MLCRYFYVQTCRYVSLSLCLSVAMSLCRYVSLSLCLSVAMSLCRYVSLSLHVSLSLCLSVAMSLCRYVSDVDFGVILYYHRAEHRSPPLTNLIDPWNAGLKLLDSQTERIIAGSHGRRISISSCLVLIRLVADRFAHFLS
jgi:hypothetical protein